MIGKNKCLPHAVSYLIHFAKIIFRFSSSFLMCLRKPEAGKQELGYINLMEHCECLSAITQLSLMFYTRVLNKALVKAQMEQIQRFSTHVRRFNDGYFS